MPRKTMPAGPGRPKGCKNKISNDLRKYVIQVIEQLEEEGQGLLQWAKNNPDDFWGKVFKGVLPKEVKADVSGEIVLRWED